MCHILKSIARRYADVDIVYPVHPNPIVEKIADSVLRKVHNIRLISPLGYGEFCNAMRDAFLIISDSGGVQEEALALGTPVLVTRNLTERPEVLAWSTVRLVGAKGGALKREAYRLLDDPRYYASACKRHYPFGKGDAAIKIAANIRDFFTADRES
jgi:UDP-N-acetylglucosamine 2-epimerase (non-hydrolysing)